MQVIILADRLLAEKSFLTCIEELKWHYIIRLPHTTHLECRFVCENCSTDGGKAKQESGIRNQESGIGNQESGIRIRGTECRGFAPAISIMRNVA